MNYLANQPPPLLLHIMSMHPASVQNLNPYIETTAGDDCAVIIVRAQLWCNHSKSAVFICSRCYILAAQQTINPLTLKTSGKIMEISIWLSLVTVCVLGAISPGPSIAVMIQITASNGRLKGLVAAIGHGLGIGCYALLAAAGLAVVIKQSPVVFESLKFLGALFLAYMGCKALGLTFKHSKFGLSKKRQTPNEAINTPAKQKTLTTLTSFTVGFLTAFLNPKIALFFLALFSQFIKNDADLTEKIVMTTTVATVDALWYCLVALLVSTKGVTDIFRGYNNVLQKAFGILLIAIAVRVVWG